MTREQLEQANALNKQITATEVMLKSLLGVTIGVYMMDGTDIDEEIELDEDLHQKVVDTIRKHHIEKLHDLEKQFKAL